MKDFVSALINRHVQTTDHVKPRTRSWFDNTGVFENMDDGEEGVDETNATVTPDVTLNRAAEIQDVIVGQHPDQPLKIVDDENSVPLVSNNLIEQKSEETSAPSLTILETKSLSDPIPLTNEKNDLQENKDAHLSNAPLSSQKSSTQKLSRKESSLPLEKIEPSTPSVRKKSIPLPSLHDVTRQVANDMHGDSSITPIRTLRRNTSPEAQQKTVAPQPIDVTIGRVEIQAIFPAEEKVIHAKKERKGVISLDDYLDQKRAKQ